MLLHIPVEIRDGFIDKLIISVIAKPPITVVPESLPRPSHNNASVGARNKVIVVPAVKTDAVRVDEVRRIGTLWAIYVTSDAADGNNLVCVLRQNRACVAISRIDNSLCPDGAARCLNRPHAIRISRG